jgi:hypothetical protein
MSASNPGASRPLISRGDQLRAGSGDCTDASAFVSGGADKTSQALQTDLLSLAGRHRREHARHTAPNPPMYGQSSAMHWTTAGNQELQGGKSACLALRGMSARRLVVSC